MPFLSKLKSLHRSIFLKSGIVLLLLAYISNSLSFSSPVFAAAPPGIISYQGRLADSSGNLLGGSGTTYYFKFSIWNNATVDSGTRLWPSSAPTASSFNVRQGVFTANIGDTASGYPHVLDYDFATAGDVYLEVSVSSDNSTFQTLSPRQRISSVPFARLSGAVSGSTTPSSFGTTTPIANSVVTIEATSTGSTLLSLRAIASQIANLFQVQNSSGSNLVYVSASGGIFASTTFQATGATTLYSTLNVSGLTTLSYASTTGLTVSGTASTTNLVVSALTSGRISFATTGGTLTDDADLTFDGLKLSATFASTTGITSSGGAWFATSGGNVGVGTTTPGAVFSVQGDTLVSGTLSVGNLIATSSTITFSGLGTSMLASISASGNLVASSTPTAARFLATSSIASIFPYASTTAITVSGTASSTSLVVSGLNSASCDLKSTNGIISCGLDASGSSASLGWSSTTDTFSIYFNGRDFVGIGTSTPAQTLSVQGNGYFSSNLFVGGTITSTSSLASIFPYASTTGLTVSGTASTTNLVVSGLNAAACDLKSTNGVISCGTDANTAFEFSPTTNFGVNTNATSTALFLRGAPFSLFASSTAVFSYASTTQFQIGTDYITDLSTGLNISVGGAVTVANLQDLAGTLDAGSGGIGIDSSALSGIAVIDAGVWSASSTLATYRGGTGWASVQANALLLGNGAGRLATTSSGTLDSIF